MLVRSVIVIIPSSSTRLEERNQIVDAELVILHLVSAERSRRELTLLLLKHEDPVLNGVLDSELIYIHRASLAEAVSAVISLILAKE
jgi:hypothetical protein